MTVKHTTSSCAETISDHLDMVSN